MAESIVDAGDMAPEFLKNVLSSVASPGILDVVIIYRYRDLDCRERCMHCEPDPICFRHGFERGVVDFRQQLRVFRQMHRARDFRLVFCVDVYGCVVDMGVRLLESAVKKEVVNGGFRYLAHKPVVICEGRTIRTRLWDDHAGASSDCVAASAL